MWGCIQESSWLGRPQNAIMDGLGLGISLFKAMPGPLDLAPRALRDIVVMVYAVGTGRRCTQPGTAALRDSQRCPMSEPPKT